MSYVCRVRASRVLELAWVLGVGLLGLSTSLGMYERIGHWGKFVHAAEGFLVAVIAGYLLLGYQRAGLRAHRHVVAAVTLFIGITFGAFWEFLEFVLDWIRYSDLQKSNTDTMTDMLWNDLAVVVGTLVVFRLYYHFTDVDEQRQLGELSARLFTPIGRLLDRHGKLLAVAALVGIALYVAALWYSQRPIPLVAPQ